MRDAHTASWDHCVQEGDAELELEASVGAMQQLIKLYVLKAPSLQRPMSCIKLTTHQTCLIRPTLNPQQREEKTRKK